MKRITSTVIPKGNRMAPKKTTSAQATAKKAVKKTDSGETEPVYKQFKNKPVEAIRHLMKVKKGVAKDALYRKEIGYVDIAWGSNSPANRGYGLNHIIEKHGWEFLKSTISIEEAIVKTFKVGNFKLSTKGHIVFVNNNILVAISTQWKKAEKKVVISCYTIKKPK